MSSLNGFHQPCTLWEITKLCNVTTAEQFVFIDEIPDKLRGVVVDDGVGEDGGGQAGQNGAVHFEEPQAAKGIFRLDLRQQFVTK